MMKLAMCDLFSVCVEERKADKQAGCVVVSVCEWVYVCGNVCYYAIHTVYLILATVNVELDICVFASAYICVCVCMCIVCMFACVCIIYVCVCTPACTNAFMFRYHKKHFT